MRSVSVFQFIKKFFFLTLFPAEEFDEIDIAANSFLFFIAGFETTASTLSYCLYELALNQDIQDKLRSEVQQLKAQIKELNYENLRELTYMDAVISGKPELNNLELFWNCAHLVT